PLCDPHLAQRVGLARRAGIKRIGTVTNAALLDRAAAAELTAAGLGLVHISLDGASRDTYNRLRVNLDFDAVAANIDGLLALRPRPAVHIQMVLFEQNRADAARIRQRWGGRAERVIVRQAQDWAGQVEIPAPAYTPHLRRRNSWPPCRYLWDQLNVSWDGTVPLCCLDYEAAQVIGDAVRQPLAGIWAGDALRGIRERHNKGARDDVPLCRRCGYYSVWW
ncbi:MAG TPA: SPASM domain-containing protein, partial [Candidatus Edwardsbacteria bacterium]|nr:SPASM domain-containing protein [Candidatus Edwardsbacteria bacterium]